MQEWEDSPSVAAVYQEVPVAKSLRVKVQNSPEDIERMLVFLLGKRY